MKKLLLMPVLVLAGILIAGLYGVLHNQISYLGGVLGIPTGIVYLILRRKSDDSLASARERDGSRFWG